MKMVCIKKDFVVPLDEDGVSKHAKHSPSEQSFHLEDSNTLISLNNNFPFLV